MLNIVAYIGSCPLLFSQVFEKVSFAKATVQEESNFNVKLSKKSNCIIQDKNATEWWHCGTVHNRNTGGGAFDEGYISKTDANGNITQPYFTYFAHITAYGSIEFNSMCYIKNSQIHSNWIPNEIHDKNSTVLDNIDENYFPPDDIIVAVGRYKLFNAENPDDYDAVILLYPLGMGLQYFEFVSQVGIATCKNTVLQTDS